MSGVLDSIICFVLIKASAGETVEVTGGQKLLPLPPIFSHHHRFVPPSMMLLCLHYPFILSWAIPVSDPDLICHPENYLLIISRYFLLLDLFIV